MVEYFVHHFLASFIAFIFTFTTALEAIFYTNCCFLIEAGCAHIQAICDEIWELTTQYGRQMAPREIKQYLTEIIEAHNRVIG